MTAQRWWERAVFYQIYPRSFADGNGDGIGDFVGMTARLDYLQALGVDALWLSPHYPSPFLDCGYDIADFCAVAPEYGTLDDFRAFLQAAHARGIRVILDLVLNHSSDQHPWFVAARAERLSPQRDWYVWRDTLRAHSARAGAESIACVECSAGAIMAQQPIVALLSGPIGREGPQLCPARAWRRASLRKKGSISSISHFTSMLGSTTLW